MHPFLQFLVFTGGAFALLAIVASYIKHERMLDQIRTQPHTLEPKDRLKLAFSEIIKRRADRGSPLVLLLLDSGPAVEGATTPDLNPLFRPWFRAGDIRVPLEKNQLAFLLNMEPRHIPSLILRLHSRLQASGVPELDGLRIGSGTFPRDGDQPETLLSAATRTLRPIGDLVLPGALPSGPATEDAIDPKEARFVDPLTGTLRPEFVIAESRKWINKWLRLNQPVAILVASVDIGLIRDRLGAAVGDLALRTLGRFLTRNVREADLIGRLQNDDFLIILNATPEQTEAVGQRLIERIRIEAVRSDSSNVRLSLHIGLAGYPDFQGTPGELFEAAVTANAVARRTGQKPCVRFTPDLLAVKPSRRHAHREQF